MDSTLVRCSNGGIKITTTSLAAHKEVRCCTSNVQHIAVKTGAQAKHVMNGLSPCIWMPRP
eukprot:3146986-Amphidinium_carterae.1